MSQHCELQEIETIWGAAKTKIRAAPRPQKMPELKQRIIKVSLWVWTVTWASSVRTTFSHRHPRLLMPATFLPYTPPQELTGLTETCFDGAYKRAREWEDEYMDDAEVMGEDDEAALSDQEDNMNDDESVGGEEEGDDDAD